MWKQIGFRDYLIRNEERASAYEQQKFELVSKFKNDRGSYMSGNTSFIQETLQLIDESWFDPA